MGINNSHTATACLMEDGKILACISEERLNRIKEFGGLPKESIKKVLKMSNTSPEEVDLVVFPFLVQPLSYENYINEKGLSMTFLKFVTKIMPHSLLFKSNFWVDPALRLFSLFRSKKNIYHFFSELGISKQKIMFVDHHTIHAYTTLMNFWGLDEALVLTLDGEGDLLCTTVNIWKDGKMERIESTNFLSSLGFLYTRLTQYLGMKPLSHEYKTMGLAAYGKEDYSKKYYEKFKEKFLRLDRNNPLRFENLTKCYGLNYLSKFKNEFSGVRFDYLAFSLQKLTEELIKKWVKNSIEKTQMRNILCSGGLFMNVKSNMKLMYELNYDNLFFFPSSGDESSAIGACIYGYYVLCHKLGKKFKLDNLKNLYFSPEYWNEEVESLIKKSNLKYNYIDDAEGYIAEQLSKGKIIGRMNGRMEFGTRALGNRSILADPRDFRMIRKINIAIKMRDFWMPFAPTILAEREDEYIENPRKIKSPYMILAFKTNQLAQKDLIAALHPWDLTCRPQILENDWNESYYKIIKNFEGITGVGGVLNTSFNIHGDPIVCSPQDAIDTLRNSGLDEVAIGNYFVEKK